MILRVPTEIVGFSNGQSGWAAEGIPLRWKSTGELLSLQREVKGIRNNRYLLCLYVYNLNCTMNARVSADQLLAYSALL